MTGTRYAYFEGQTEPRYKHIKYEVRRRRSTSNEKEKFERPPAFKPLNSKLNIDKIENSYRNGKGWEKVDGSWSDYDNCSYAHKGNSRSRHEPKKQCSKSKNHTDKENYENYAKSNHLRSKSMNAVLQANHEPEEKKFICDPTQVRVQTLMRQDNNTNYVNFDSALHRGFTAQKALPDSDRSPAIREGPKALNFVYKPKFPTYPKMFTTDLSMEDGAQMKKKFETARMDLLVKTESFKSRRGPTQSKSEPQTNDTTPYPYYAATYPDQDDAFSKIVNFVRLELSDENLNDSDMLSGRLYFSMNAPANLSSVKLNYTYLLSVSDDNLLPKIIDKEFGEVKLQKNKKYQPCAMYYTKEIDDKKKFNEGEYSIPFDLIFPQKGDETPTFVATNDVGKLVISSYVLSGEINFNGKLMKLSGVPFIIKGKPIPTNSIEKRVEKWNVLAQYNQNNELVVIIGEKKKPKKITYELTRNIDWKNMGGTESKVVNSGTAEKEEKKEENKTEFEKNLSQEKYKDYVSIEIKDFAAGFPPMKSSHIECNYKLKILEKKKTLCFIEYSADNQLQITTE